MGNSYFQFKQFTVHQDRSTLKVSTDSCIFGAWVAGKSRESLAGSQESKPVAPDSRPPANDSRLLDIGAGTGLLMLMAAQQYGGHIDGIEIDTNAFEQARENLQASPWAERLRLFHGDIKSFTLPSAYNIIISNPPFFEGDLTSPALHKNLAKHDAGLTLDALLAAADRCAAPRASLAVLLPFQRADYFKELAAARGWQASQQLLVRQTPSHGYFRAALWLEKQYTGVTVTETLVIHTAERAYTAQMINLMKPYYL